MRPRSAIARVAIVGGVMAASTLSILAFLQLAMAFGIPPEKLGGPSFALEPGPVAILAAFVGSQVSLVAAVQRFVHGRGLRDLGTKGPVARPFLLGFVAGALLHGAHVLLGALVATAPTLRWAVPPEVGPGMLAAYYLIFVVLLLIATALCEELVYRAYAVEQLAGGPAAFVVFVLIALAFAALHNVIEPFHLEAFVARTAWALLLTVVYARTRSLWLVGGVHAGSNFIPFTLGGNWKTGGLWELSGADMPDALSIAAQIGLVGLAIAATYRVTAAKPAGAIAAD